MPVTRDKAAALACGVCGRAPAPEAINPSDGAVCPGCGQPLALYVFPRAFDQRSSGRPGERLFDERESSCYYHPAKRAVRACDHCGRFMCALCEVPMAEAHLCPQCVERGVHTGGEQVRHEYVHYDSLALHLAFWPLALVFPIFMVVPLMATAPVVFYLVIRHWRTPLSAVPRRRWRFVVAAVLAAGQLAAMVIMVLTYMGVV